MRYGENAVKYMYAQNDQVNDQQKIDEKVVFDSLWACCSIMEY